MKIIIITLLTLSLNAFSATKVIYVKGDVTVNEAKLTKKSKLNVGNIIKTFEKSLAILEVKNLMKIKINENSTFIVKNVVPKKRKASLFLKAGSAFLDVIKNKNNNITLTTKSTAMAVRGTKFFAAYGRENKDANDDLWMCVKEGKVVIETAGKSVTVKEGEGVFVEKGNAIGKPRPYKWTQNLNWEMNTKKDVLNKVNIKAQYDDLVDLDYD